MRSAQRGSAAGAAVSRLVHPLDQITSLLKFNRQKVSRRNIDPFQANARLIISAGRNLVGPKRQAIRVRQPIEEVIIMLSHEEARLVDRIRPRADVAVVDGVYGRCLTSERRDRWTAEGAIESV